MLDEPVNVMAKLFGYPLSNGPNLVDEGIAGGWSGNAFVLAHGQVSQSMSGVTI
jgi:hypothetical protein